MRPIVSIVLFIFVINFSAAQKPHQKSLVIVFDGTTSMLNNVAQLKPAARRIVNKFASHPQKPIHNYVLTVFHDPGIEPTMNSLDSNDLLNGINRIDVSDANPYNKNNIDYPEMSITGLKQALQYALPNSVVFLISDAEAKDYYLESEVMKVLQAKQITANFLIEESCPTFVTPGCKVYCNLAWMTSGQCFSMAKNDLDKILTTVDTSLDPSYSPVITLTGNAGTTKVKVGTDVTMDQVCVGLTGKNPRLSVSGIDAEVLKLSSELVLSGYRYGCIDDPRPGTYDFTFITESEFMAKLFARSELKFDFGFSLAPVASHSETNVQPLTGYKTILSVFPTNSSLIKTLTDVKLIKADGTEVVLNLKKVHDGAYSTDAFDVPTVAFKVHLRGKDKLGIAIDREISSYVSAVPASVPEVTVESSEIESCSNQKARLKCKVKSQIPITITWTFGGATVKEVTGKQSKELVLELNSLKLEQKGVYICTAKNDMGTATKQINLKVTNIPSVEIEKIPTGLTMFENLNYSLKCNIKGSEDGVTIQWVDGKGTILLSGSKVYDFKAQRIHDKNPISCEAKNGKCTSKDTKTYQVIDLSTASASTNIKKEFSEGQAFDVECPYAGSPSPNVQWFKDGRLLEPSADGVELVDDGQALFASRASFTQSGNYTCMAMTNEGPKMAKFEVFVHTSPRLKLGPGKTGILRETVKVKKGSDAVLECFTEGTPKPSIRWLKDGAIIREGGETFTIPNVQRLEEYACSVFNRLGAVQRQFKVLPRDE